MFTMMNDERLSIGMQGLGLAKWPTRAPGLCPRAAAEPGAAGARQPEQPADPIIVHPDVRRMAPNVRA